MYEKHDEAKIAKWTALVESAESCALKTNADLAVSAVTTETARYWADRAGEYAVSARNLLSLCADALAAVRRHEAGAWRRLDMLEGRLADAEEKARMCAVALGENRNAAHAPTREPVTVA